MTAARVNRMSVTGGDERRGGSGDNDVRRTWNKRMRREEGDAREQDIEEGNAVREKKNPYLHYRH